MSKYRRGNYPTGEPKFYYFRKNKHMPKSMMRKVMWIAKCIKIG